jgi:hypothetical protein
MKYILPSIDFKAFFHHFIYNFIHGVNNIKYIINQTRKIYS